MWYLVLFTVMPPHVLPMWQEFEYKDEAACESDLPRYRKLLTSDDGRLAFTLECKHEDDLV
jgi:hypothetical protein